MTAAEIVSRMLNAGYVDYAIASKNPQETLQALQGNGLELVGSEFIDGKEVFYLDFA